MQEEINILRDVLRLVTVEEIEQLTTIVDPSYKISLTNILETYFWGEKIVTPTVKEKDENTKDDDKEGQILSQAKILPFTKENNSKNEASPLANKVAKIQETEAETKTSISAVTPAKTKMVKKVVNGVLFEEEEIIEEEKVDRVAYIIEEQLRSKESQRKIKMQEIYDLYKQTASVAIDQEKKHKGDLGKSLNIGVLINKKQS